MNTTEILRKKIQSYGNTADLSRKTGIPQQVLHRFSAGTQKNIRLDTAEELFAFFNFRIDRTDYRARVSAIAKEIVGDCEKLDAPRLRTGLFDLHQILEEYPNGHPSLKNASLGMYQLFTSWDMLVRDIERKSTKLAKLIHLPISGM